MRGRRGVRVWRQGGVRVCGLWAMRRPGCGVQVLYIQDGFQAGRGLGCPAQQAAGR